MEDMRMKKLLSLILSMVLLIAVLPGCKSTIDDTENNLIIEYYQAGYGDNGWIALEEAFEKKNPDKTVTLIPNSGLISSNAESKLAAGPAVNAVDLFFCGDLNIRSIIDKGANVVRGYDVALEDLTEDVYNAQIDGVRYEDKMTEYYRDYNENNGKYYSTNWATGPNGIAYRNDFFVNEGWEIPATTEELKELIVKMKEKEYVPFIWPGGTGYWSYATQVWWAQYAGEEEMESFFNGYDRNEELSAKCFYTQAFLETYKALEMCIGDISNSYTGSISATNYSAQNKLWIANNKICMMPNGSWLETEMSGSNNNIRMMKAPVLSAVIKMVDPNDPDGVRTIDRFETIKHESTLRAVVKAIDAGETSYDTVSSTDFNLVKDMRNYVTTTGTLLQAVIPIYSNAKPLAKEFLKFMATDEAMQIFYDACGAIVPFDTTNLNSKENATLFENDLYDMSKDANWLALNSSKNKLFYRTELDFQVKVPEVYIGSESDDDRKTAVQFFEFQYQYINSYWSHYKQLAGL